MNRYIIIFLSFIASNALFSQLKAKRTLILGPTIHVGNGEVIEQGALGFVGNKITIVRNSLSYTYNASDWDTIIRAAGKHVYPGFVCPNNTLGLTEIDAVRATRDFQETGLYNPHVRAEIAFNVESKVLATVRTNGVLIAQATPRGGSISGQSSIMHLDGWNWEDARVKSNDGIHVNWPTSITYTWNSDGVDKKANEKYQTSRQSFIQFIREAKAYLQGTHEVADLRFEAFNGIFDGNKRLYINANDWQELLDVVDFVKELGIKNPVIVGGYDSWRITQQLKEYKIPVMLPRTHSLPQNENDPVDFQFRLPYLLQKAGVKFCLQNEGDMEAMNARNIPFQAGTAMAYGLTEEEAVRAISLSSCEIMGIGDILGSITEGKIATFFLSEGPALEMKTNKMMFAFVNGSLLFPVNSQTELYQKYSKKLGQQSIK